jgi:predicted nucleic acid-binding protein
MNVAEGETIYFLDTSALAKLHHQEQGSEMVQRWAADHTIRLWLSDLARAEFYSVFVRKVREGELAEATLQTVLE